MIRLGARARRHLPAVGLALTTVSFLLIAVLLGQADLWSDADDLALQLGIGLVLTFLVVLVVRYLLLLWLGHLHHVESWAEPMDTGFAPPVTIVVPAYNEEPVIVPALRSLLELRYPSYEVLVVDDGSTDGTYAAASTVAGRYGDVVVRVVRKANGGKATALNHGLALARSDYVLCMDADSRLAPDTLRAAMRHFLDERVGAVAGNVKVVNRGNLWTRLQALEYIEGLNLPRRAQGFLRVVNIVPGPIGVFRRDALARVGGYDTDTFAEDADLTLKLLVDGWHVTYEDRAIAWTEAPETLHDLIKQRYRWTRGILQALRKRSSWLLTPAGGPAVWLSLLAMLFEAILWPTFNVVGNVLFAAAALSAGAASGVMYWWLLLSLLDVAAALHSIAREEEDLALVPYAIVYRLFFIAIVDVAKLFATLEELTNVRMSWGKLARAGRI